jgi:hypothetical protein
MKADARTLFNLPARLSRLSEHRERRSLKKGFLRTKTASD